MVFCDKTQKIKYFKLIISFTFYPISGTSIIFSIGTLTFLILSGKERNIFKRKFSERLVVYLAVADILFRYLKGTKFKQYNE